MSGLTPATAFGPVLCACPRCWRQWDASGLAGGTELRCTCGELFPVPSAVARSPRVFRCSQCGAALPSEGRACSYCSSEITLEERGLSGVCPGCSARLSSSARFCMECGIAIAPQRLTALRADVGCPRCKAALHVREIGTQSAIECSSCAGLWLTPSFFEELCAKAEDEGAPIAAFEGNPSSASVLTSAPAKYIPCITCSELMLRRNFGESSGVVIDLCKSHGVWLDHRELARVLAFVRKGGLRQAREKRERRVAREAERRAENAPVLQGGLPGAERDAWERQDDLVDALAWLGRAALKLLR